MLPNVIESVSAATALLTSTAMKLAETEHESQALDEALAESFPASDPAAVSVTRVER